MASVAGYSIKARERIVNDALPLVIYVGVISNSPSAPRSMPEGASMRGMPWEPPLPR